MPGSSRPSPFEVLRRKLDPRWLATSKWRYGAEDQSNPRIASQKYNNSKRFPGPRPADQGEEDCAPGACEGVGAHLRRPSWTRKDRCEGALPPCRQAQHRPAPGPFCASEDACKEDAVLLRCAEPPCPETLKVHQQARQQNFRFWHGLSSAGKSSRALLPHHYNPLAPQR